MGICQSTIDTSVQKHTKVTNKTDNKEEKTNNASKKNDSNTSVNNNKDDNKKNVTEKSTDV